MNKIIFGGEREEEGALKKRKKKRRHNIMARNQSRQGFSKLYAPRWNWYNAHISLDLQ